MTTTPTLVCFRCPVDSFLFYTHSRAAFQEHVQVMHGLRDMVLSEETIYSD
ncbi:MAG: hypothetical protein Q8P59_02805 [Dehalococcoidia bacterium]|nr:hypothetical protein [Dehalococcoidia bacterium]